MVKYAGVEFANPSSQWEERAYCPDNKKQDNFYQIHAFKKFKRRGVYINLHIYRPRFTHSCQLQKVPNPSLDPVPLRPLTGI
jgi:hypothetical protein